MAYYTGSNGNIVEGDAGAATELARQGFSPSTQEDINAHNVQIRSGGVMDQLANIPAEAGRRLASGAAAVVRGVEQATASPEALSEMESETGAAIPPENVGTPAGLQGKDIAPALYTPGMLERRDANPISTAIGGAIPAVAANVLLPGSGALGIASAIGISAADAASQEATDAEIQNRGINGEHILRNAALETVFTGAAMGLPAGASALLNRTLDTAENIVRRGAGKVVNLAESFGNKAVAERATEAVAKTDALLENIKLPPIASNPNSQRSAIETLADSFMHGNAVDAGKIEQLASQNAVGRFKGLQALSQELPEGSVRTAVDDLLKRDDLWGQPVVDHLSAMETIGGLRPDPGADPAALAAYADSLRAVKSNKLNKAADLIDELAQTSALQPLAEQAPKIVGQAVRRGSQIVGSKGGWLGYMIGTNVGDALAPLAEKAVASKIPEISEHLVNAAQALKTFAENDQRMTARLLVDPEAAGQFGRVIGLAPTAAERFQGGDKSMDQAFARHRAMLQTFAMDPSSMLDQVDQHIGSVGDISPELHRQMATQAINISAFLQQKMPPARGVSVARPNGTPPSPLEIRTYALYAMSAIDPSSVMADARAGRLRKEQVDTLQALWPSEYNGLKSSVIEQLGHGSTTVTRQRMNLLFGFGGAIDPALGPKITAMVNSARDATKQGAQGGGGGGGIQSKSPPSAKALTPGGLASMQLLSSGSL